MTQKTKNQLVFFLFLLLAGGVYVWFFVLNKGTLELKTGVIGYEALLDGEPLPCSEKICQIKLKTGVYQLFVGKEKHASFSETVAIHRGEVTVLRFDLDKIYALEPSNVVPDQKPQPSKPLPKKLGDSAKGGSASGGKIVAHAWSDEGNELIFLDGQDERVKRMDKEGELHVITALQNLTPPLDFYWSPNEAFLVAHQQKDLYWIDLGQASRRKKVLNFEPVSFKWSPSEKQLLLNDEVKKLYHLDSALTLKPIDLNLNLAQSVWIDEKTLLFMIVDPQNRRTELKTYDPETGRVVTLVIKFEFIGTQLSFDSANQTAYVQKDSGEWVELKLK